MIARVTSLTEYIATQIHVDLQNFMLTNILEAQRLAKQEKMLHEKRTEHEVQAELCRALIQEREKILRVITVSTPLPPAEAAAD